MPRKKALPKLPQKVITKLQKAAAQRYLDEQGGRTVETEGGEVVSMTGRECHHKPCSKRGTRRRASVFYCEVHYPTGPTSYCSHGANNLHVHGGQCAWCGAEVGPDDQPVLPRPCWVPRPLHIVKRPPEADAYLASLLAEEF